jgi:hypothetical protein
MRFRALCKRGWFGSQLTNRTGVLNPRFLRNRRQAETDIAIVLSSLHRGPARPPPEAAGQAAPSARGESARPAIRPEACLSFVGCS